MVRSLLQSFPHEVRETTVVMIRFKPEILMTWCIESMDCYVCVVKVADGSRLRVSDLIGLYEPSILASPDKQPLVKM